MLDMKHMPCFRAAAAWGNFSALRRNLILLLSQFPGASNHVLPHGMNARKRFETVRTFHRWRVFFQMHSGGLQVPFLSTSLGKRYVTFSTVQSCFFT